MALTSLELGWRVLLYERVLLNLLHPSLSVLATPLELTLDSQKITLENQIQDILTLKPLDLTCLMVATTLDAHDTLDILGDHLAIPTDADLTTQGDTNHVI